MRTARIRSRLDRWLLWAAAAALAFSANAEAQQPAQSQAAPAITVDACPSSFPANWRCLRVSVPEDYAAPEGTKTEVRVVVAPAQQSMPKPEAVILVQGGPGVSGTAVAGLGFIASTGALQADHDLVVVDERYVAGADALICPPPGPLDQLATWGEDPFSPPYLQACLSRSAPHGNLSSLTTDTFARDIESVRAALGYGSVEFYTGGYGGLIVQEYIRRFPDRVRAAVLADTGPMDEPISWSTERWTTRAVKATLAACSSDIECRRSFPNVRQEFDRLIARIGHGGLMATIPATGGPQTVHFDRATVLHFLGGHYHFMRDVAAIPFEIHELASNDPSRVSAVASDIVGYQQLWSSSVALGVWMSVKCSEEAPAMRKRIARGEHPENESIPAILSTCKSWPHGDPPSDFHKPFLSDVPVLLLASPMEPGYPAELAPHVAANFSHVRIILDANHGHVFDDDWSMCLGPQAIAFLESLDLAAVDPRCAGRFQFRPFKLPKTTGERRGH